MTLAHGETYIDSGATALDAVDGVVSVLTDGSVNENALGDYIISYSAKDKAGNEATSTREVTVVDLTAPVITLNGESTINLTQWADEYIELGAIATDNVDGDITVNAPSGLVDTTVPGSYLLTYTVTDVAGHETTAQRTVNVAEQKPFIITWLITPEQKTIQLPLNPAFTAEGYNYRVDWGDDSVDSNQTTAAPIGDTQRLYLSN
ncbi:hypothetical protein CXF74_11880 [Psychromonas sp. Urea-02u-13]|nr:hypothetical protein CXF74_11880 [Psychromonas sp. Urea-02u-13]